MTTMLILPMEKRLQKLAKAAGRTDRQTDRQTISALAEIVCSVFLNAVCGMKNNPAQSQKSQIKNSKTPVSPKHRWPGFFYVMTQAINNKFARKNDWMWLGAGEMW
ncbi:MAG: hypothetical protein HY936_09225 [Nitrosomonadales bacterium]|nr:hypothetical protein [Nitrosomonadales bacterium]